MNQVPAGLPAPGGKSTPMQVASTPLTPERWELAMKIIEKARFYRDRTKPACRTMGFGQDLDRLLNDWDEGLAK